MPRGAALRYVTRGCPPARAASPVPGRAAAARAPGAGRPRYVRRCGRLPERRSAARTGGCVSADVRGARCGVCGQRGSGSARSVPARCFAAPAGAGRNAGFWGVGALRAAVPASLPAPGPLGSGPGRAALALAALCGCFRTAPSACRHGGSFRAASGTPRGAAACGGLGSRAGIPGRFSLPAAARAGKTGLIRSALGKTEARRWAEGSRCWLVLAIGEPGFKGLRRAQPRVRLGSGRC